VVVAVKNKVDLAMGVAVGSSIQIALFVIPLLILLAWAIGQPLTLYFDVFGALSLSDVSSISYAPHRDPRPLPCRRPRQLGYRVRAVSPLGERS
jgi:hypothetical protein